MVRNRAFLSTIFLGADKRLSANKKAKPIYFE
uniref:Uncharacterized protein n=1 Tax=Utricularia reniformis TaxID=192314 RepID=A0A1Y0B4N8_9LAMI|nr:hypothetical protein AEK19_MT2149 [Utricularia reniformis]ART32299.1 hypothetical protein AEK19_MT2149 [Utricularia reniformis]